MVEKIWRGRVEKRWRWRRDRDGGVEKRSGKGG